MIGAQPTIGAPVSLASGAAAGVWSRCVCVHTIATIRSPSVAARIASTCSAMSGPGSITATSPPWPDDMRLRAGVGEGRRIGRQHAADERMDGLDVPNQLLPAVRPARRRTTCCKRRVRCHALRLALGATETDERVSVFLTVDILACRPLTMQPAGRAGIVTIGTPPAKRLSFHVPANTGGPARSHARPATPRPAGPTDDQAAFAVTPAFCISSASSPLSYISIMMSDPPTNSPLT